MTGRYINLHFTYLLTYLLINPKCAECAEDKAVCFSTVTQFVVVETPFLVARITVALACPKTIQQ